MKMMDFGPHEDSLHRWQREANEKAEREEAEQRAQEEEKRARQQQQAGGADDAEWDNWFRRKMNEHFGTWLSLHLEPVLKGIRDGVRDMLDHSLGPIDDRLKRLDASLARMQQAVTRAREQTEVELWPEKGESEDAFMSRRVADLTVCIGASAADRVCSDKWEASQELGKKGFVTAALEGNLAVEPCQGGSCSCGGTKGASVVDLPRRKLNG
jgi:hypothetical protein